MNGFLQYTRRAFRALYGMKTPAGDGPISNFDATWLPEARRHRIEGLLADHAEQGALSETWSRHVYGRIVYAERLVAEAGRIVGALSSSVDDLRLVKGPALAALAWPKPELRNYDDLDFRCSKSALDAMTSGLQSLGYLPVTEDALRREHQWAFGWGIEFRHPDGMIVEVNHRMFPPHYPWPARLTRNPDLWVSMDLDGMPVQCPSPALHLLLACSHAAWHGWERIGWLVDIAGLLVQHPGVFLAAKELAGKNRFLGQSLECACGIADNLFGPLPEISAFDPAVRMLIDQGVAELEGSAQRTGFEAQRKIHRKLMTSHEFARYTVCRLLIPGDADFQQWALPSRYRFLYWILRPFGAVRRVFGKG